MTARRVRTWLETVGTQPLFIEPGSPWKNGYCESFNDRLREECLNGEIFDSLKEAQVVIEMWRKHYNTERPHRAPGYRPPAPLAWVVAASLRVDVDLPSPAEVCLRPGCGRRQGSSMNSHRSALTASSPV
jgi:transposase InsO family protein